MPNYGTFTQIYIFQEFREKKQKSKKKQQKKAKAASADYCNSVSSVAANKVEGNGLCRDISKLCRDMY